MEEFEFYWCDKHSKYHRTVVSSTSLKGAVMRLGEVAIDLVRVVDVNFLGRSK